MSRPENAPVPDPSLNVQFIDSLVPDVTAGRYTLTAYQTLTGDTNPTYLPTEQQPVTQHIEVRAPRFSVQPEWIHGAYPPPGATGLYDDVLPHITLSRPTLPWEREEGVDDSGTRLPWMALLVFGEGELINDPHALGQTEALSVSKLLGDEGENVVLPAFDQAADPIPAEDMERTCRTILVPAAVFHAVAPAKDELHYLTHVRRVDERHQGVTLSEDRLQPGDYAVAVANRLPRAHGGRYVAHLVSLEGWLSRLPEGSEDKETYTGNPDERLRLISLWSWSFETLADHAPGFAALTQHFVDTEGTDGSELLLRVPVGKNKDQLTGPEQQHVAERLSAGYLPVSCRTESGRATFGWYRGPLIAEPAKPMTARDRRRCAAEALIHLEQYGVFDVSLATAFTAGRGVAFADHQFCATLLRLRGKVRQIVEDALGGQEQEAASTGVRARIEHLVANGLGDHLHEIHRHPVAAVAPAATGPRPAVTPVPAATDLPGTADLTVRRLRTDADLQARLGSAVEALTGEAKTAEKDEDLTAAQDWLLGLRNLTGVPFAHLVPDARMLPTESLRFFHVDTDWTTTLLEGALSVGLAHSFDLVADDLLFGPLGKAALPEPSAPVTGLLLRSRLVSGWPALEIRPYADPKAVEGENALKVLRREALADDVLLVLIEGVPGRVEIAEPQQGVHFGIDELDKDTRNDPLDDGVIRLRALKGTIGAELGEDEHVPSTPGLRSHVRAPGDGQPDTVLRIGKLADGIRDRLGELQQVDPQQPLAPSQFAIQMINAAQRRTFTAAGTTTTGDHHHG